VTFLDELKRRKVFRVGVVYAATGYVVLEAADLVLPRLGVPDWAMSLLVGIVVLGFPIALVLAWALELTPEGAVRRSEAAPGAAPRRSPPLFGTRTLIVTGLLVAVGVGLSAGWLLKPGAALGPELAGSSADSADSAETRPSVAVLPFDNLSADPEQGYFADGLTEEILNALAALPNLLVTARTSSFFFKDKDVPVDEIAERLGVDHVLEGSVRRSGEQMRVTAQLVRARDGFHVWSHAYDRPVDDAFAVQTDIAAEVASALGILLDERQRARMEGAGVRDPEAYALYAKGFEVYSLAHGGAPQVATLVRANEWFDRAFARAPDLWAAPYHSADLYSHILLELAGGADPTTLPAEEVRRARDEHERWLREASRAAPNQAARDFIEITRRLFSDDWSGLAELSRRAFQHTEACGYDQWMHAAGLAFGMEEPARDFFLRATRCNALDESNWLHAAIASIYAGDAARALEIAERGLVVADVSGFGLEEVRLTSLLALERFDEARASLSRLGDSFNTNRALGEAWIAAARGDRATLDDLRRRMTDPHASPGIATALYLFARAGDRAAANARAAEIDARPAGPMYLMVGTYLCLCGAPFDLEVTPNLAARLEEAGLTWPPVESMHWPLKDW
jgi:TolB-like protein